MPQDEGPLTGGMGTSGAGETLPPWWETGTPPEPFWTKPPDRRSRVLRLLLVLIALACLAGFLLFFVWVGVAVVQQG